MLGGGKRGGPQTGSAGNKIEAGMISRSGREKAGEREWERGAGGQVRCGGQDTDVFGAALLVAQVQACIRRAWDVQ